MTPDDLGRIVREAWVRWAKLQPNPKPAWLLPYDALEEAEKEADRQIGRAVALAAINDGLATLKAAVEENNTLTKALTTERLLADQLYGAMRALMQETTSRSAREACANALKAYLMSRGTLNEALLAKHRGVRQEEAS